MYGQQLLALAGQWCSEPQKISVLGWWAGGGGPNNATNRCTAAQVMVCHWCRRAVGGM